MAVAVRPAMPEDASPAQLEDVIRALRRAPHRHSICKIARIVGVSPYYVRDQLSPPPSGDELAALDRVARPRLV
jgi:hypothetical protein